jgi:hypothetical protein
MKPDFIPGATGWSRRQEGDKVFFAEVIRSGRIRRIELHPFARLSSLVRKKSTKSLRGSQ